MNTIEMAKSAWESMHSVDEWFEDALPCFEKFAELVRSDSESENARLRDAIQKTIDENGHLADGDDCTLRHLVRVL
jgi:hypothetical protein